MAKREKLIWNRESGRSHPGVSGRRALAVVLVLLILAAVLPAGASAQNPYLPLWERIPDGEPRVFTDRETGEERVYLYGSHDTTGMFCGNDYVVWSAPADDLFSWRHEGISFETTQLEGMEYYDAEGNMQTLHIQDEHVLYAPDVIYYPGDSTYYLFGFLSEAEPKSLMFIASSEDPAGPFEDPRFLGWGFDPAVLVDDETDEDGRQRVYLYYSVESERTLYACELDPETMSIREETLHSPRQDGKAEGKNTMLSGTEDPFFFMEGPSIRKIGDVYVLSYARSVYPVLAEIAYATSDNPYGDPSLGSAWEYGGVIIASNGETIANPYNEEESITTYFNCNNHGGLAEINGQWYQFYHRSTNVRVKRQSMVTPVDLYTDEEGRVVIRQAEMTSEGFETDGLDPFEPHYASIACCAYSNVSKPGFESNEELNFDPDADHGTWFPIRDIKNQTWIGYKYFNFGEEAGPVTLELTLKETAPATVNVYCAEPRKDMDEPAPEKTRIGTVHLDAADDSVHTVSIPLDDISGRKAIFLEFLKDEPNKKEICQINLLQFVRP